jgi:hypothetical protein
MNIRTVEAELFPCERPDGHTDRHDEANSHFSQLCEGAQKVLNSGALRKFVCFVWVSEQSAIISLCSIITGDKEFYCAVRTESSNSIQVTVSLGRGKERVIMLNCWLLPAVLLSCTNTIFTF